MRKNMAAVGVAAAIAALGILILAAHAFFFQHGDTEGLTVVLVIGVIALVAVISLVAAVYSWLGLTDSSQALALPDGSVRSVITLLLLLIFSMLAMFFYEDMTAGTNTLHHQTQADVMAFVAKNPGAGNLSITLEPPQAAAGANTAGTNALTNAPVLTNAIANAVAPGATAPAAPLYSISYGASSAAGDFAKQLMAGLQALLTTVIGFYCGAKTATSAAAATASQLTQGGGGDPAPKSVAPNPVPAASSPAELTISGLNLNSIVHVQLEQAGGRSVALSGVTSNPSQVKGTLAMTPDMVGQWEVVLSDASGKTWKTPQPIAIS
jgi:hypothetical protein